MDEMTNNIEKVMETNAAELTAETSMNGNDYFMLGCFATGALVGAVIGIKLLVDHIKVKKLEKNVIDETIDPIEDVGSVE